MSQYFHSRTYNHHRWQQWMERIYQPFHVCGEMLNVILWYRHCIMGTRKYTQDARSQNMRNGRWQGRVVSSGTVHNHIFHSVSPVPKMSNKRLNVEMFVEDLLSHRTAINSQSEIWMLSQGLVNTNTHVLAVDSPVAMSCTFDGQVECRKCAIIYYIYRKWICAWIIPNLSNTIYQLGKCINHHKMI